MTNLVKSEAEIELMRRSGAMLRQALAVVAAAAKPGVTGTELDRLARDTIVAAGGEPGFLGFNDYPATICLSVNDQVVHGIPGKAALQPGDVVSIDIGVRYKGWNTDAARTVVLQSTDPADDRLVAVAQQALDAGIDTVRDGVRLGDVQAAIQAVIDAAGFGNVTSLTGHGIGRELHEPPSIPNAGTRGAGPILQAGMVICLEPMITRGTGKVVTAPDGWTIATADGSRAAHVEDTILVTRDGAEILTR